ncbi:thioredoxin reductase [Actinoplanes sp. NBRC 14428]|uniref:Thioredoxin reductase n=1 Tax=Pseudosporangium ferrugineum TaxID=439699 RepID=A0A2T0RCA0_9ACTN|nr:NAD(P)/FAD-dependent oxidoreductase [Pseudosporangium ferrugineum]PRY18771.1 thioredoxin reductase [Pseudosporangium ferrugineum]BCJ51272.1 thioredoxin reductase [Actinoplanes sp. NBRC 14428]
MTYDVIVIGGGPAGLSAALVLGRALRSVLVVDAASPRNAPAEGIHNYLTRDGIPPAEFRELGRAEVAGYGGEVIDATVATAAAGPDGLSVTLTDGREFRARRLLLTTGLTDELPDIPGLREQWGHGVLHCPYCHGYEVRGRSIGIIGSSPMSLHQAQLWRQWSDDVVLFLHTAPAPDDTQARELAARGITIETEKVAEVVADGGRLTGVRLTDGRFVARDALVSMSRLNANADPLRALGLQATENDFGAAVIADPTGRTPVPGVWVAGNVTDPMAQVVSAAAAGLQAGAMLNSDLITEEVARAVAR